MNRIDWLVTTFGAKIRNAAFARAENVFFKTDAAAITKLLTTDPTTNARFGRWLAETYLKGSFRFEDLARVKKSLELFLKAQARFSGGERDIGRFASLIDLEDFLEAKQLLKHPKNLESGKQQRRNERAEVRDQSIILLERDDVVVAVPLTRRASQWWGQGTRWCTSAKQDNAFRSYDAAPLIIILTKSGKFQAYPSEHGLQFMDAKDVNISEKDIEYLYQIIPELMKWLALKSGKLNFIPRIELTREIVAHCSKLPGFDIRTVPYHLITQDACLETVKNDGFNLKSIPPRFLTQELYMMASTQPGFRIDTVPSAFVTPAMCENAIRHGHSVKLLPKKFVTEELCIAAVKHNESGFKGIPDKFITEAVRDAFLETFPDVATTVLPKELWTTARCTKIMTVRGILFDKLPEHMRTPEMAKIGLKTWGYNLGKIPGSERTYDLCSVAIKSGQVNFHHIPSEIWDRELILLAAKHAYGIVGFLEKAQSSWLTHEVVLTAISNGKADLDSVPDRFIDRELCLLAVKAMYQAIRFVPDEFFDAELARIAIASDSRAEQFVALVETNAPAQGVEKPYSPYPKWYGDGEYVRSLQTIFSKSPTGNATS
jgi:hypothetical protein